MPVKYGLFDMSPRLSIETPAILTCGAAAQQIPPVAARPDLKIKICKINMLWINIFKSLFGGKINIMIG